MTRKKYQMPEADLKIASRCYRQGRTPDEVVDCLRMQRARVSIWFDDKLGAWVIQDCDGALHKLARERLEDLPFLLTLQNADPGHISTLSGDESGETVARHIAELAQIRFNLHDAAERRAQGVVAPLNRSVKPATKSMSDDELADLFKDFI